MKQWDLHYQNFILNKLHDLQMIKNKGASKILGVKIRLELGLKSKLIMCQK